MTVLETERLVLSELSLDDADFILGLVNEPSWLQFIGDRGVRTLEDARAYLRNGPLAMYASHGFGLYRVARKNTTTAIGLCGLLKRETLADVDIGFALLPAFWGCGYAREAAAGVLDFGLHRLGLRRIVAIAAPDNVRSHRLLQAIGLRYEGPIRPDDKDIELALFGTTPADP